MSFLTVRPEKLVLITATGLAIGSAHVPRSRPVLPKVAGSRLIRHDPFYPSPLPVMVPRLSTNQESHCPAVLSQVLDSEPQRIPLWFGDSLQPFKCADLGHISHPKKTLGQLLLKTIGSQHANLLSKTLIWSNMEPQLIHPRDSYGF